MPAIKSQNARIKAILLKEGRITTRYAISTLLTTKLSTRIGEIEQEGWGIHHAPDKVHGRRVGTIYTLTHAPAHGKHARPVRQPRRTAALKG